MVRHEQGCTANPERLCRLHPHVTGEDEKLARPVSELLSLLAAHNNDADHGLSALRGAAEDCPCCILAALRQSGLCKGYADEDGYTPPRIGQEQFDFKKELAQIWANENDAKAEAELQHERYWG
jgi:hypothetical protein